MARNFPRLVTMWITFGQALAGLREDEKSNWSLFSLRSSLSYLGLHVYLPLQVDIVSYGLPLHLIPWLNMIHRLILIPMMVMMKVPLLHSQGGTMAMIYTHTPPSIISYIIWARVHSKKRIFVPLISHWLLLMPVLGSCSIKQPLKKHWRRWYWRYQAGRCPRRLRRSNYSCWEVYAC